MEKMGFNLIIGFVRTIQMKVELSQRLILPEPSRDEPSLALGIAD